MHNEHDEPDIVRKKVTDDQFVARSKEHRHNALNEMRGLDTGAFMTRSSTMTMTKEMNKLNNVNVAMKEASSIQKQMNERARHMRTNRPKLQTFAGKQVAKNIQMTKQAPSPPTKQVSDAYYYASDAKDEKADSNTLLQEQRPMNQAQTAPSKPELPVLPPRPLGRIANTSAPLLPARPVNKVASYPPVPTELKSQFKPAVPKSNVSSNNRYKRAFASTFSGSTTQPVGQPLMRSQTLQSLPVIQYPSQQQQLPQQIPRTYKVEEVDSDQEIMAEPVMENDDEAIDILQEEQQALLQQNDRQLAELPKGNQLALMPGNSSAAVDEQPVEKMVDRIRWWVRINMTIAGLYAAQLVTVLILTLIPAGVSDLYVRMSINFNDGPEWSKSTRMAAWVLPGFFGGGALVRGLLAWSHYRKWEKEKHESHQAYNEVNSKTTYLEYHGSFFNDLTGRADIRGTFYLWIEYAIVTAYFGVAVLCGLNYGDIFGYVCFALLVVGHAIMGYQCEMTHSRLYLAAAKDYRVWTLLRFWPIVATIYCVLMWMLVVTTIIASTPDTAYDFIAIAFIALWTIFYLFCILVNADKIPAKPEKPEKYSLMGSIPNTGANPNRISLTEKEKKFRKSIRKEIHGNIPVIKSIRIETYIARSVFFFLLTSAAGWTWYVIGFHAA